MGIKLGDDPEVSGGWGGGEGGVYHRISEPTRELIPVNLLILLL